MLSAHCSRVSRVRDSRFALGSLGMDCTAFPSPLSFLLYLVKVPFILCFALNFFNSFRFPFSFSGEKGGMIVVRLCRLCPRLRERDQNVPL